MSEEKTKKEISEIPELNKMIEEILKTKTSVIYISKQSYYCYNIKKLIQDSKELFFIFLLRNIY